jgi:hypothetical protein
MGREEEEGEKWCEGVEWKNKEARLQQEKKDTKTTPNPKTENAQR